MIQILHRNYKNGGSVEPAEFAARSVTVFRCKIVTRFFFCTKLYKTVQNCTKLYYNRYLYATEVYSIVKNKFYSIYLSTGTTHSGKIAKPVKAFILTKNMAFDNLLAMHSDADRPRWLNRVQWDWGALSFNPNITREVVQNNLDKPWDWWGLSSNPGITWDDVQNNLDWDWEVLSSNPNITWEIIQSNFDTDSASQCFSQLYWEALSGNPNTTWDIVQNNPDSPWDWEALSFNSNITWKIVQNNLDRNWDWGALSSSLGVVWEFVRDNLDKSWDWKELSRNPNITWDIVQNNPDKSWDWKELSRNPNITWDIVQNNPDKSWNLEGLSRNPIITWDIVQNNPNRNWDWRGLSLNEFNLSEGLRHVKAKTLQQSFFPVAVLYRRKKMDTVIFVLQSKKLYNGAIIRTVLGYL